MLFQSHGTIFPSQPCCNPTSFFFFFLAAAQLHVAVEQNVTPHIDATQLAIVFASASLSQLAETDPFPRRDVARVSVNQTVTIGTPQTCEQTSFSRAVRRGVGNSCRSVLFYFTAEDSVVVLRRSGNQMAGGGKHLEQELERASLLSLQYTSYTHTHCFVCWITGFETVWSKRKILHPFR